jgi:hypothetical protein
MKKQHNAIFYVCIFTLVAILGAGCSSLFTKTVDTASLPVVSGAATTNDPTAVAYEKLALQLNATYNPTPSEPIIASLGGALLALTSAFSGWYARHHTATEEIAATKAAADAVNGKT